MPTCAAGLGLLSTHAFILDAALLANLFSGHKASSSNLRGPPPPSRKPVQQNAYNILSILRTSYRVDGQSAKTCTNSLRGSSVCEEIAQAMEPQP